MRLNHVLWMQNSRTAGKHQSVALYIKTYESIYAGETNNRFMLLVSTKQKCDLGEILQSCAVKTIPVAYLHRLNSKIRKIGSI